MFELKKTEKNSEYEYGIVFVKDLRQYDIYQEKTTGHQYVILYISGHKVVYLDYNGPTVQDVFYDECKFDAVFFSKAKKIGKARKIIVEYEE